VELLDMLQRLILAIAPAPLMLYRIPSPSSFTPALPGCPNSSVPKTHFSPESCHATTPRSQRQRGENGIVS